MALNCSNRFRFRLFAATARGGIRFYPAAYEQKEFYSTLLSLRNCLGAVLSFER